MIKVAHRGASGYELENSERAFLRARAMGAAAIELDIQATADGMLVVLHDKRLDRTTNATGLVRECSWAQLSQKVRLLNGETVPTLEQILSVFSSTTTRVYLELIDPGVANATLAMARRVLSGQNFVLSSFHHEVLLALKTDYPEVRTMALFECSPIDPVGLVKACRADEAGVAFESISQGLIRKLVAAGVSTLTYTINKPEELRVARELGVSGVFTDFPDLQ